jgi:hypothetical protein
MLDYDCVRDMEQSEVGVRQAVRAFYQNDSYFPRPHFYGHTEDDVRLWEAFKVHFLEASRAILRDCSLAIGWVCQIGEEGRRRAAKDMSCVCQPSYGLRYVIS